MEKFIFAFHGGKMPDSPEEGARIMAKWGDWMQGLGQTLADPGSILGPAHSVSASGVSAQGGADPLSGYMIVLAADQDAANTVAKGCPIIENEGRVSVAPLIAM